MFWPEMHRIAIGGAAPAAHKCPPGGTLDGTEVHLSKRVGTKWHQVTQGSHSPLRHNSYFWSLIRYPAKRVLATGLQAGSY